MAAQPRGFMDELVADMNKALAPKEMQPLKQHLFGLEAEFFLLGNKGHVIHNSDRIIKKINQDSVKKEVGTNMIEINTKPFNLVSSTMKDLVQRISVVNDVAEKSDTRLFYYGTYPGKFTPSIRSDTKYTVKQRIFGKERFKIAGRCCGFHCHFALPRGIFDRHGKRIRVLVRSKRNENVVDSYNMIIALDPAMTTFLQSSPFYQGKYYGKDSRIILYRGNKFFGIDGLYTNFPDFGSLPKYTNTVLDLSHMIEENYKEWSATMRKLKIKSSKAYGSAMNTIWGPLKINPLGTFEVRGMDINRFHLISSAAVITKFMLQALQEDRLNIKISHLAIREPFKTEDGITHIPPFSYVNFVLQRDSAIYGMESDTIVKYCSNLLKLSRKIVPSNQRKLLHPLHDMVKKKQTVSDEIIKEAKKMGVGTTISNKQAAELALRLTDDIHKEIKKTEKMVESIY